jgi:uncharacterized protein (DUF3084 family)
MSPSKSLKALRSASVAFLEDGGSMLHSVDSLLRDIQRTLRHFEEREKALSAREAYVQGLEKELQELMARVQQQAAAATKPSPAICETTPTVQADEKSLTRVSSEVSTEAAVHQEIAQLKNLASAASQTNSTSSPSIAPKENILAPLPTMASAARHQRKKRRG